MQSRHDVPLWLPHYQGVWATPHRDTRTATIRAPQRPSPLIPSLNAITPTALVTTKTSPRTPTIKARSSGPQAEPTPPHVPIMLPSPLTAHARIDEQRRHGERAVAGIRPRQPSFCYARLLCITPDCAECVIVTHLRSVNGRRPKNTEQLLDWATNFWFDRHYLQNFARLLLLFVAGYYYALMCSGQYTIMPAMCSSQSGFSDFPSFT